MGFKERLEKIKKVAITKPYIYSFIAIFLVYLIINIIINQVYVTFTTLFTNNLKIIVPYVALSLVVAFLIALNINLVILRFKELRMINKESGMTFFGVFGGLLGGACPSCFVGLFPAFLGLFGVTATLSSLPFFGIEILIGSAAFLIISIAFLTRENVCKVRAKGGKNE
ncbi:MAG: hypothetical protein AABX08_00195 [Nanoarchaeota archaeon]